MDSSGTKLKKLSDDNVKYINADSNYVYYVRSNSGNNDKYAVFSFDKNSLCRISRDGGKITILDPDPCIYASLIGNYIYYLHYDSTDASTTLYKVKIDGSAKEKLMGSAQQVFAKMYEQAQAAQGAAGAGPDMNAGAGAAGPDMNAGSAAGNDDDVIDADFKEV